MLQQIFAPIEQEINSFNRSLDKIIHHNDIAVDELLSDISLYKGKQLRPAMVFLSAATVGNINRLTYTTALAFELLHYSSLIHDDVVDNGQKRHNQPTINAARGVKTAVLTGDYLLSKCMTLVAQTQNMPLLEKLSQVAQAMTTGELLQLVEPDNRIISQEQYLRIIDCKTASLIAACFEMGVVSVQENKYPAQQWNSFGRDVGMIFQLKDDLLDYQPDNLSQKDVCKDIYEHKITLPLIVALQQLPADEQLSLFHLYKTHQGKYEEIKSLIEKITQHGGISYTENMIAEKSERCIAFVQAQKDSVYKEALLALIRFIKERTF
ncbi:MAG: polyprenyl synthetase family protein [Bacteroidales bacterium]|nr:polyprenyl synthetase family protein [Bacteroidales bacterium]